MSIEKEINQSKFRNDWQKALVNIIYTCNWVMEEQKNHLDRGGLTLQQYNILRILKGSGQPISTLKIRERMLDKMSDTSRIVDRLIAKNLVEKCINQTDKRLVDVSISQKGIELINWMDNYTHEIDDILKNLNEAEVQQLNELLDKVRVKEVNKE